MNALTSRSSLFDEFFRDFAPGFYVRPLHGDPLPAPAQIKVDVKESDKAYTVQAEVPGVSKDEIHVNLDSNVVTLLDLFPPSVGLADFRDVYMVYEIMDTDLHQIIRSPQPLSDDHCQYFTYQVCV